jgi:hypothetical protein
MIARTVLAIALACLPAVHAAARLQLTDLPIVLPPAASPTERFAAEELSRYLQAITGKPFAIRESGGNGLLIGRRLAQKAGVAFSTERYGGDGFLLRRTGSTIYLAGMRIAQRYTRCTPSWSF